ncbi:hypothetical protein ILP92_17590 [Maribius pontilimi]|uniref:Protease inhibitor Inh n=1 Tax=Palleronia pontilimi TaxID=1964209 RepID=A0A934MFI4_9RHOB|nr:hypothetical protein [Palleronia pontilimi]MBJ3764551.1 hypothetical protein [Palleronia pontilimi]
MRVPSLAFALSLLAAAAAADPLPDMAGDWSGSGVARRAPSSPDEAVRCRLQNTWEADNARLRVRGRCAVPGRSFDIDGALARRPDDRLRGFWSDPEGRGQTSVVGRSEGDRVAFAFSATDPDTGIDVSQTVTWTLSGDTLRFLSRHRAEGTVMADIRFTR